MIGTNVKIVNKTRQAQKRVRDAHISSLGRAAATARIIARRSIRRRKKPAAAGRPPHSKTGKLRRAIKYKVDKQRQEAFIGPDVNDVGTSGRAHEHGGLYKGDRFDKRPFMGPALEALKPRLPDFWRNSVS